MKKMMILAGLLTATMSVNAQNVDTFNVGPYEVEYNLDEESYKYQIRPGANPADYFDLKKETVVVNPGASPIDQAWGVDFSLSLPAPTNGQSKVFTVDGVWKKRIGDKWYFNAGLSLALSFGTYGKAHERYFESPNDDKLSETLFEAGVPLSIEYGNLDRNKATLFVGFGVAPKIFSGGKVDKIEDAKGSGFLIAPKLEFGAYVPSGDQLWRIALFTEAKLNCAGGDYNLYKERVGTQFFGGSVGLVF